MLWAVPRPRLFFNKAVSRFCISRGRVIRPGCGVGRKTAVFCNAFFMKGGFSVWSRLCNDIPGNTSTARCIRFFRAAAFLLAAAICILFLRALSRTALCAASIRSLCFLALSYAIFSAILLASFTGVPVLFAIVVASVGGVLSRM